LPNTEKYIHQGNKEKPELLKVKTSAGHGKLIKCKTYIKQKFG
jgi:hypothetical protein